MFQHENNTRLQGMRFVADAQADEVVARLFEEGCAGQMGKMMAAISSNDEEISKGLPDYVQEYFTRTATLPAWADRKLMEKGAMFFKYQANNIYSLLGILSLPFCYAAADGAQVLYLSQRIRKDTLKRLEETGQFVSEVMEPNAMNPQGKGIRSIQKVRLMHAAVRYHVQKSGQWNNDWGLPINQEDMLGTNLAFSFVILRGLRQIGCSLYFEEARAFMHLWNVIGAMLGIREELLPADEKDAMGMANYIMHLRFRPSEAGRELTKALLGCLEAVPPYSTVKGFATTYMRYLVGDEVANILGLPPSNWSKTLITGIRAANAVRSMASHVPDEHTESLFDQMIKNKQKTSFEIPLDIRGAQ